MAITENPVYGRKIFFLNPPYAIKSTVIDKLRAQEFETYYIESYKVAKSVLRENKDAICFIDIDDQMPVKDWFNFIKSFEEDEILSSIFIGILSQKIKLSDKNQFLLKANIAGGFIMMTEGLDTITEKLIRICEINGAKGRRQYVRLDCKQEKNAVVHASKNGRLYQMKLIDISSVGFACALPPKDKGTFNIKEVITNINISLDSRSIDCEAAIFAIKEGQEFDTLVMLLLPNTPSSTKTLIQKYVFSTLQKRVDNTVMSTIEDVTDYSIEPKNIKDDQNLKFFNDDIIDNVLNAQDISELQELEDLDSAFV